MRNQKIAAWILFIIFYFNFFAVQFVTARLFCRYSFNHEEGTNSNYSYKKNKKLQHNTVGISSQLGANVYQQLHIKSSLSSINSINSGGPSQPEMASFKSVNANDMVNLFTGDFSYNIPLMDVGGYPINISYSAGATMEQEASWVGLGWNINPGSITRNMRGLPDDFNGSEMIHKEQCIKSDKTYGVSASGDVKLFGWKQGKFTINAGVFYNNKRGFGMDLGAGVGMSLASKAGDEKTTKLNFGSLDLNSQSGFTVNPSLGISLSDATNNATYGASLGTSYNSREGMRGLQITGEVSKYATVENKNRSANITGSYPMSTCISFAKPTYAPSIRFPFTTNCYSFDDKDGVASAGAFSNLGLAGYFKETSIAPADQIQEKPAFGFLYLQDGNDNPDALLDFNRMNDGVYTQNTPTISIPYYTYDVFNISGEGTGGSFHAYRGDLGFVHDTYTKTRNQTMGAGIEFGAGSDLHIGGDLSYVTSPVTVYKWSDKNNLDIEGKQLLKFQSNSAAKESVYFKNPAEKAIIDSKFLQNIGSEQLVRVHLKNDGSNMPFADGNLETLDANLKVIPTSSTNSDPLPTSLQNVSRTQRDKRSQVITWLTAEQAAHAGFDKTLNSYPENQYGSCANYEPIPRYDTGSIIVPVTTAGCQSTIKKTVGGTWRHRNHISEIDVTETDGKRYVYGIPVYNVKQIDRSFSVSSLVTGNSGITVGYSPAEDSKNNTSTAEHFFQSDSMPGYAHSFLLTALLSPDYVDVTGDGITDDDLGDAVKFNYTQTTADDDGSLTNLYNWRTPFDGSSTRIGNFNIGLQTDNTDNKASYIYGQKELWYMHSIESKNMIAVFHLSNRNDSREPNQDGTIKTPQSSPLRKLDRIDLYAKNAFMNDPSTKPIKSIFLVYSYALCPSYPYNANGGKLTLTQIYTTYNGNKRHRNVYNFAYGSNPTYLAGAADRWGTYKPKDDNPLDINKNPLTNIDYPYSTQDQEVLNKTTTTSAYNASAWNLSTIKLPAGGEIDVDYEADDYTYVQNRRSMEMCKVEGFGSSSSSTPDKRLNPFFETKGTEDYSYVYITVPDPIRSTDPSSQSSEIASKYLDGITQLALKLWVKLPADNLGNGVDFEPLTMFANINNSTVDNSIADNNNHKYLNFGVVASSKDNNNAYHQIYLKLSSPVSLMETAVNFLRNRTPAKAFPNSYFDPEANPISQVIYSLVGMIVNLGSAFTGFDIQARTNLDFGAVSTDKSFVRLDAPFSYASNSTDGSGNNMVTTAYGKKGGGYRVKEIRIKDNWDVMSPKGSTVGEHASVYGQHYDYTTTADGTSQTISSGVATYEPMIGAEENPFKEALQYSDKVPLGPTDYGFTDLPLLETFFPSPMVGYSKVRVTSIHNSNSSVVPKSGVGTQETQYYTAKDFPVYTDFTPFDHTSCVTYKPNPILDFLHIDSKQMVTLSQGFRIILNDMHGKVKSEASYPESDPANPITYTEYFYKDVPNGKSYTLTNSVTAIKNDGSIATGVDIGKDVELMFDFREHKAESTDYNLQLNFDVVQLGPIPVPIPSFFTPPIKTSNTFRSVSTLKVVNQYGIVDHVLHIDKGSAITTSNLAFDAETGNVLVTSVQSEYNKLVYNLSYPAHWVYSGMSPAYQNVGVTYLNVSFLNGQLVSGNVDQTLFESGDEIYVNTDQNPGNIQNCIGCILAGNPVSLTNGTDKFNNPIYKIWAVDISKGTGSTAAAGTFVFLDQYGTPYTGSNTNITIIRSGKRNLLNASIGSITSLDNPLSGTNINNLSLNKVLQASAQEYKEKWKVEDAFYTTTSSGSVPRYAPLHKIKEGFENAVVIENEGHYENWINGVTRYWHYNFIGSPETSITDQSSSTTNLGFEATQWNNGNNGSDDHKCSHALLDMSSIPIGDIIYNAKLSLYGHSSSLTNFTHSILRSNDHGTKYIGEDIYPYSFTSPSGSNFRIKKVPYAGKNNFWADMNTPIDVKNDAVGYVSSAYQPYFSMNFCDTCGDRNFFFYPRVKDNRLDLTNLVQQMQFDRVKYWNSTPQYSPAIELDLENSDIHSQATEYRVCFNSGLGHNSTNEGNPPLLEIQYYNKCETYGLYGNGPIPKGVALSSLATYWDQENVVTCHDAFGSSETNINPYVHGLIGNWRANKSYIFKGDRLQTDATAATNITSDGTFASFTPYWSGSPLVGATPPVSPATPNNIWVWNSELSQVNRKGLEVENFDAMMRYNSGIYGYNSILPVAVTNNAHYRETGFDGFEDYGYTSPFCLNCGTNYDTAYRHWNIGLSTNTNTKVSITQQQSHTGSSSLKVATGGTFSFTAGAGALPTTIPNNSSPTAVQLAEAMSTPNMGMPVTSNSYQWGNDPKGNNLTGNYYSSSSNIDFSNNTSNTTPFIVKQNDYPWLNINYPTTYLGEKQPASMGANIEVIWKGHLVVNTTGLYTFGFSGIDNDASVIITKKGSSTQLLYSLLPSGQISNNDFTSKLVKTKTVNLSVGEEYEISIGYVNLGSGSAGCVNLQWEIPNAGIFTEIPSYNLFPDDASFTYPNTVTCSIPSVTPDKTNNQLIDKVALIPGKQMLFSYWVKEGLAACNCSTYSNNGISITTNSKTTTMVTTASQVGPIIEGWQRKEYVFTVPTDCSTLSFGLSNSSTSDVYFDDLRLLPFNGNMKSFVYDPASLRLVAELDDNNYATLYEYDDDGTLVRVKKETTKGVQTIKETRSALQTKLQQ